jgi:two-component system, NarL family, nitrate/nitrite response regulator NarL
MNSIHKTDYLHKPAGSEMTHALSQTRATTLPIRVMLVDGHRCMLWGLEKLIDTEKPDMQVVATATSAAEAMRVAVSAAPHVILLDLDLNGECALGSIPGLIEISNAIVLVLTGTRDPVLHDKAMLAGARGVIEKAESAETILKAIATVHKGEIWIDRSATSRIFNELSRRKTAAAIDPEQRKIATLTRKERSTVAEIAHDAMASTHTIAQRLCISESTLRNHLTSIYAKLELCNRLELYAYANKHGINKVIE